MHFFLLGVGKYVKISVSDPSHFDVDPDPRIHLSVIVDPDLDPRIHILKKLIRIRFQSGSGSGSEYLFFIEKFMSDKLKCLFITAKI